MQAPTRSQRRRRECGPPLPQRANRRAREAETQPRLCALQPCGEPQRAAYTADPVPPESAIRSGCLGARAGNARCRSVGAPGRRASRMRNEARATARPGLPRLRRTVAAQRNRKPPAPGRGGGDAMAVPAIKRRMIPQPARPPRADCVGHAASGAALTGCKMSSISAAERSCGSCQAAPTRRAAGTRAGVIAAPPGPLRPGRPGRSVPAPDVALDSHPVAW